MSKSGDVIIPIVTNLLLFTGREEKCLKCLIYVKRLDFNPSYVMPNVTIRSPSISVTSYLTEMLISHYPRG